MTESIGKYQVSLCRKTTCCPQLIIENGQYIITDDFGGKVTLEQQHIKELVKTYQEYEQLQESIDAIH